MSEGHLQGLSIQFIHLPFNDLAQKDRRKEKGPREGDSLGGALDQVDLSAN